MTSIVFSALLLLQTAAPAAGVVNGRLTVEGGAPAPSSFTIPLTPSGAAPSAAPALPGTLGAALANLTLGNSTLTIRPQIDGAFRLQLRTGEFRLGTPAGLPPGYTLQSITYGGVDLLQNPLKIPSGNSAELLVNLAFAGPVPTVSVSGRVTGITPGQFLRISLREPNGGELGAALETSIGADGTFTFPKVLPGRYIVYLRLRTLAQVTVSNKDVTGLIVAHPQDILVAGHVITEGTATIPTTMTIEGNGKTPTLPARTNGTFVLSLGSGENSVTVRNIPEAYRIKSITYGDVDLQKEPLKLDGPANWDIVVRLAPKD